MAKELNFLEGYCCLYVNAILNVEVFGGNYTLLKRMLKLHEEPIKAEDIFAVPKIGMELPDKQFYEGLLRVVFRGILNSPRAYTEIFLDYYRSRFLNICHELKNIELPSYEKFDALFMRFAMAADADIAAEDYDSPRGITENIYASVLLAHRFSHEYGTMSGKSVAANEPVDDISRDSADTFETDRMVMEVLDDWDSYGLFVKEARRLLAERFGVRQEKLDKYILDRAKEDVQNYDLTGTIKAPILSMINRYYGRIEWFVLSIDGSHPDKEVRKEMRPLRRAPDMGSIMDDVLKSFISDIWGWYTNDLDWEDWANYVRPLFPGNTPAFYRRFGKRLENRDPTALAEMAVLQIDEDMLLNAVYADALYRLFGYSTTRYYELKLRELQYGFDLDDRQDVGNGLFIDQADKLRRLEETIERQQREIDAYRDAAQLYAHESQQELKASLAVADEKADEISQLKEQIAAQNLLVEKLQEPETEPDMSLDFDILKQFKFLFVGRLQAAGMQNLKKMFPGSAFMETETFNPNNVGEVSAVIILAKYVSHAMTYRVDAMSRKNIKRIYYNGRNREGLLTKMYEEIFG